MRSFFLPNSKIIIVSCMFNGVLIAFPIFLFVITEHVMAVAVLIFESPFVFMMLYNCFGRKIQIDYEGIKYISLFKRYKLRWEDIKEIGVGEYGFRQSVSSWIYFSLDKVSPRFLNSYTIGNRFISVGFRKSIIRDVKKYWPHRIDGITNIDL